MRDNLITVLADKIQPGTVGAYPLTVGTVDSDSNNVLIVKKIISKPGAIVTWHLDTVDAEIIIACLCRI